MDEQDVCSLLENLRFIRSLRALRVQSEDQRDASCYTTKLNTFGSCTSEVHETLKVAEHSFQVPMPNSPLLLNHLCFGAHF